MPYYTWQEKTLLTNQGEQTVRYPRLRIAGCMDTETFVREAVAGTTFNPAEARACLELLASSLADRLAQGYSVQLDGLGTFTPRLGLREGFERETGMPGETRRNARSICVKGISFKPQKQLVERTGRRLVLTRDSRSPRRSSARYTPDERLAIARQYLADHEEMTLSRYCILTGLLKDKASRELRRWEQSPAESGILGKGRGVFKRWVAAAPATEV